MLRRVAAICIALWMPMAPATAQDDCKIITVRATALLEQCGTQLRSFVVLASDQRWRVETSGHATELVCRVSGPGILDVLSRSPEPAATCPDEPRVGFAFVDAQRWKNSGKDAEAIFKTPRFVPVDREVVQLPPLTCPVFDVSIGQMSGRAVCSGNDRGGSILAVFGDDQVAFALPFSQEGKKSGALRDSVVSTLLPQFMVERATGDAALMRWIR